MPFFLKHVIQARNIPAGLRIDSRLEKYLQKPGPASFGLNKVLAIFRNASR